MKRHVTSFILDLLLGPTRGVQFIKNDVYQGPEYHFETFLDAEKNR